MARDANEVRPEPPEADIPALVRVEPVYAFTA
jgi:hypothetical protein